MSELDIQKGLAERLREIMLGGTCYGCGGEVEVVEETYCKVWRCKKCKTVLSWVARLSVW